MFLHRLNNALTLLVLLAPTVGCSRPLPILVSVDENEAVREADSSVRNRLLERLQGQSQDEKMQTLLVIIQQNDDLELRRDALMYMRGVGPEVNAIAEPLVRLLLEESDQRVVADLRRGLIEANADVEDILVASVANADRKQTTRIIEMFGAVAASSPAAMEFLVEQLDSEDRVQVLAACAAIEKIGSSALLSLPGLIAIADLPRVPLDLGSENRGLAFRQSREIQEAAIRAIAAVGPNESAIAVLTKTLGKEPGIAKFAASALATLGTRAASALPELEKLQARNDHGGKDVKTRLAREAAEKAIAAIR